MSVTGTDLAAVPLFQSLSDSERDQVATWFELRACGEGPSASIFVTKSGEERTCLYDDLMTRAGEARGTSRRGKNDPLSG